jgi:hypothetical protein
MPKPTIRTVSRINTYPGSLSGPVSKGARRKLIPATALPGLLELIGPFYVPITFFILYLLFIH